MLLVTLATREGRLGTRFWLKGAVLLLMSLATRGGRMGTLGGNAIVPRLRIHLYRS